MLGSSPALTTFLRVVLIVAWLKTSRLGSQGVGATEPRGAIAVAIHEWAELGTPQIQVDEGVQLRLRVGQ